MGDRLHIDRASFDFAQDDEHRVGHRPTDVEKRKNFILSEFEGRTAPIQGAGGKRR
jgi:hypothetical protein